MDAKYRAAVIGLGRMGSTIDDERGAWSNKPNPTAHTPSYLTAGVKVVAGADPRKGQRDAYRKKWGIESLYEDFREMLEKEKPDIVSICTTAQPRAVILDEVLALGTSRGLKAIWVEKPLCVSLEEGDRMVAACRRVGIPLAVGCCRSWSTYYERMREVVEAGELGDLLQIIGLAESFISHNGSHVLSLINRLVNGRVRWVFGHMDSDEHAAGEEDLQGNGYLVYDNGVHGFVRMMSCGAADWQFELIGTRGRLHALADAQEIAFYKLQKPSLKGREEEPVRQIFPQLSDTESPNVNTVRDLLFCITTGNEPKCSGVDALHALEIAVAMRTSHRLGGVRVELPLADRSLLIFSRETRAERELAKEPAL